MKSGIANKAEINRRNFISDTLVFAGACMSGGIARANPLGKTPNIIMMVADNLGWRDLSCYGDKNVETPHIDKLANEGVRFTNAFVTASSCSPSRASIVTGQSPHSVGVLGLTHIRPSHQLPTSTPNLPRSLKNAGYRTAIDGKQHIGPYKLISQYGYMDHLNRFSIPGTNKAKRFISDNRDKPFYLEMNFMQTHRPAMPGSSHAYRQHPDFPVKADSIEIPSYWNMPDWPEIREDVAGYYSGLLWMDHLIGDVTAHLGKTGIGDNTIVIFVSDNGPMYPGGIGACYDFGIGTPLIIKWPHGFSGGKVIDGLVSTIDIMPTCLNAANVPIPSTVQGKSLLPLASGEHDHAHDAVFAEMTYHVRHTPMRVIRTREFKYIENLSSEPVGLDMCKKFDWAQKVAALPGRKCCVPRPPEELYKLAEDPTEMTNLADNTAYREVKKKLQNRLHKWRRETRDPLAV